jgi:hypothetical protein
MRPAVYVHHVSRIATSMLQEALIEECEGKSTEFIESLMKKDDAALILDLIHSESSVVSSLAEGIYTRNLYKRALYAGADKVNVPALQGEATTLRGRKKIGARIADEAGVEEWQVLVDIPPLPPDLSMEVKVRNRHSLMHLSEISPLVDTLNLTRRSQWRIGVYSPSEVRKLVEEAAIEVLHVKKATKQDRLSMIS